MRSFWIVVAASLLSLHCTDRTAPVADAELRGGPAAAAARTKVTVLTLNMYPGTNLDLVVAALSTPDPADDGPALGLAIQTLLATDYSARAGLLADEIARVRPHAVALQEVSTFDIAAEIAGQPTQIDFLPILEAALATRGLHYTEAGVGTNHSLTPAPGVAYSQGDALLVDADRVAVTSAAHHIFDANVGEVAPGIVLRQGWSATMTTWGIRWRGSTSASITCSPAASAPGRQGCKAKSPSSATNRPSGQQARCIPSGPRITRV